MTGITAEVHRTTVDDAAEIVVHSSRRGHRVRVKIGGTSVYLDPAASLELADRLVDAVEKADRRTGAVCPP